MYFTYYGLPRKAGIFIILAAVFSGVQPDFKSNSISSIFSIAPALATYGGEERNNSDREFCGI